VSGVGNPDAWNPGIDFFDLPREVVGGVSLRTYQVVWGYEDAWIITGDTPPAGGNWARLDVFSGVGCMDSRTIVKYRDYAFWANATGIYKTEGSLSVDLTRRAGISNYWRALVAHFNPNTGWQACGGIYHDCYVVTVFDNTGTLVVTLAIDITREIAFEWTNIPAAMYAERSAGPGTATADGSEELFFAHRILPRTEKISPLWTPTVANASDGDGVAVKPSLETPFYKIGSASLKRLRRAYVTYDVRTAGGSPSLTVSFVTTPEDGAAYTPTSSSLPTTTAVTRRSVEIRRKAYGVAFKIAQNDASADTRLEELEIEGHSLEQSR